MSINNSKILYWSEYLGFEGGIERYAFQTASLLRSRGARVDYVGEAPGRNAELFRTGFDRILSPEEALADAGKYDLTVLHKLCPSGMLKTLDRSFGSRLVFWAHDHDLYCPRRYYYTPGKRRNCHRSHSFSRCALCGMLAAPHSWRGGPCGQLKRLWLDTPAALRLLRNHHAEALSEFMRNNLFLNGFSIDRLHVIPPFIAPGEPKTEWIPGDVFRLLFLGQLIRGKGCDLFLDVLSRLTVPYLAVIAGDGNDRSMLEEKARSLGLTERVHFTGWLPDPESCFAGADLAVFPFRWQEPFGLCGLEAIAHGVPVVAFDTGGIREWLMEDLTGIAVPELDVSGMANAIVRLYGRKEKLSEMSRNGIELTRSKFSENRFTDAVEELIRRVS